MDAVVALLKGPAGRRMQSRMHAHAVTHACARWPPKALPGETAASLVGPLTFTTLSGPYAAHLFVSLFNV